jgi:hypothetical protein
MKIVSITARFLADLGMKMVSIVDNLAGFGLCGLVVMTPSVVPLSAPAVVTTVVPVSAIAPAVVPAVAIAAIAAPGIIDIAIILIAVSASLVHIILHRLEIQTSFEIVGIGRRYGERTADYGDCCSSCAQ